MVATRGRGTTRKQAQNYIHGSLKTESDRLIIIDDVTTLRSTTLPFNGMHRVLSHLVGFPGGSTTFSSAEHNYFEGECDADWMRFR